MMMTPAYGGGAASVQQRLVLRLPLLRFPRLFGILHRRKQAHLQQCEVAQLDMRERRLKEDL